MKNYRLTVRPKKRIRPKRLISVWAVFHPMTATFGRIGGGFHIKHFMSTNVALSLSIFDDQDAAERLKRLLPAMRLKVLFQLELIEKDGLIQQTSKDIHHFSWWRSITFDLESIKILEI
ncbi:MAG: hypothetical protein IPL27_12350 [Lewinellaceae bacterium]|nr:hypothetical protein [Lewinellaceae bacterium]